MKNTTWIRIIHDEFEKFKSRTYLSKQLEEAKADFLKEIWLEWAYKLQMIKKKNMSLPHWEPGSTALLLRWTLQHEWMKLDIILKKQQQQQNLTTV